MGEKMTSRKRGSTSITARRKGKRRPFFSVGKEVPEKEGERPSQIIKELLERRGTRYHHMEK